MGGPGTGKSSRAVSAVTEALTDGLSPSQILFVTFNPQTRDQLEQSVRKQYGGWSGRLVYNTRMLLECALELIPPWERLIPLSEYQQLLWLQASLEASPPFGNTATRLSPASMTRELYSLLRQLKRGGIDLGLLRHRIASKGSDASLALIDFLKAHSDDIGWRGFGDFVDQISQVVRWLDSESDRKRSPHFDLIVVDDLHLAHRLQWQLLELFLPAASQVLFFSEAEGPFFRQWVDMGYRQRLRALGISVNYEYLQETHRLWYPTESGQLPESISLHSAHNALEEGLWIAEQVDRLVSESQGGVRFSGVAVIQCSEAAAIEEAFRLYRIPYDSSRDSTARYSGIWVSWLRWFEAPNLVDFRRLLSSLSPDVDVSEDSVSSLYRYMTESHASAKDDEVGNDARLVDIGRQIRQLLVSWRDGKHDEVITRLPRVLARFNEDSSLGLDVQAGQYIVQLMSEYGTWCRIMGRRFRMGEFLDSVVTHAPWNPENLGRARLGDRVQMWSIPDSRGQDARFVFLSGTNDGALPLPYRRRSLIPENDKAVWQAVLQELGTPADLSDLDDFDHHWARELERFQLASSRALERLYITYCQGGSSEETLEPSPFLTTKALANVEEASLTIEGRFPCLAVPKSESKSLYVPFVPSIPGINLLLSSLIQGGASQGDLRAAWDQVWQAPASKFSMSVWQPFSRQSFQLPQDFALSYSKIKTYLDCPRKFYYENVLRIEFPPSYQMLVGTTLHRLAQRIHEGKGGTIISNLEVLRGIAEECFAGHSELFQGDAERQGWLDYVMARIANYLEVIGGNPPDVQDVETSFRVRWKEELWFSGRIDRLDRSPDGRWSVVDYKKSGKEKAMALINQFRARDDDFQFPIYYFYVADHLSHDVGSFQMIVFDFNNSGAIEIITMPISQKSSRTSVSTDELQEVRQRIVTIGNEMISPRADFTKKPTTQCRGFFAVCPHLPYCPRSGDVLDPD